MDLNDEILNFNNGSWDNPPNEIIWNKELLSKGKEIIKLLSQDSLKTWGFKDPRSLVTLNFWIEILKRPKFVGTFRNPYLVADSLLKRNNMSIEESLLLWKIYNRELIDYYWKYRFPIISFDIDQEKYNKNIDLISNDLHLNSKVSKKEFFEEGLKNKKEIDTIPTDDKEVNNIYLELKSIYESQF
jgi:hypothetical protein